MSEPGTPGDVILDVVAQRADRPEPIRCDDDLARRLGKAFADRLDEPVPDTASDADRRHESTISAGGA